MTALGAGSALIGDPQAHRVGLINFVTPNDECVDQAIAYAHRVAAKAPTAVQYMMTTPKLLHSSPRSAIQSSPADSAVTPRSPANA